MQIYGAAVADKLDNRRGILKRRFYRQHCTPEMGSYTKDLTSVSNDLSSVFILDNSPAAYRAFSGNIKIFLFKTIVLLIVIVYMF